MLLKDLFDFLPKSPHPASYGRANGKYPFFNSSNIIDKYVDDADYDGEYLIIGDGGTGNCKYYKGKFSSTDHTYVLKPKQNTNCLLIKYFLEKDNYKILNEGFKGVGIKNISKSYIQNIDYKKNAIYSDDFIINSLSTISKIIKNEEKQLSLYDELIKSRFIEMFNHCEKVDLSTLADITMGQSPDSKSYNDDANGMPFFQGKGEYGNKVAKVAHWTTAPSKIVDKDVVLMSVRAPVGPVNFSPVKCCIGRGLCGINAKIGKTNNEFLYNALNIMQDEIAGKGVGSTFAAITKKDVYEIKIPNAPIELCDEFSALAQQIDKSKFIYLFKVLFM